MRAWSIKYTRVWIIFCEIYFLYWYFNVDLAFELVSGEFLLGSVCRTINSVITVFSERMIIIAGYTGLQKYWKLGLNMYLVLIINYELIHLIYHQLESSTGALYMYQKNVEWGTQIVTRKENKVWMKWQRFSVAKVWYNKTLPNWSSSLKKPNLSLAESRKSFELSNQSNFSCSKLYSSKCSL